MVQAPSRLDCAEETKQIAQVPAKPPQSKAEQKKGGNEKIQIKKVAMMGKVPSTVTQNEVQ